MHQQRCGGVAQTPEFQITWDGGEMDMGGNGYGGEMTKGKTFMGGKWQKWYGGKWLWGGGMTRHQTDTHLHLHKINQ